MRYQILNFDYLANKDFLKLAINEMGESKANILVYLLDSNGYEVITTRSKKNKFKIIDRLSYQGYHRWCPDSCLEYYDNIEEIESAIKKTLIKNYDLNGEEDYNFISAI